jgi:hypothetical protein
VSPLDALLGLFGLVLAMGLLSLVGLLVHLATRPKAMPTVRDTDALRLFEPRGGRQRFSVRLFEAGALAAVWILASSVLTLLLYADQLVSVFGGALAVGTWWTWRRGAFRGPPAPTEGVSRSRRRRRG